MIFNPYKMIYIICMWNYQESSKNLNVSTNNLTHYQERAFSFGNRCKKRFYNILNIQNNN